MKAKARRGDPFDALGNSYRRAIVELLADQPHSVQEIADRLGSTESAVRSRLHRARARLRTLLRDEGASDIAAA